MTDTTLDQSTWLDDEQELPRRARRKLVTPATGALAAVIVAAAGFAGGVEVQKSSAAAPPAAGPGAGARAGGFAAGPPAAAGAITTGEVKSKHGSTLYVTGADGTTVKVKTTTNAKISRNASTDAGEIHPGDTVVIQGTTAADGTVDATSVNATASGVTGGTRPGGGATSNGGTR
jgi:hypothetical protein